MKHNLFRAAQILLFIIVLMLGASALAEEEAVLEEGINIIKEGATDTVYNIDDGKAVMIEGTDGEPIVFSNCTFNLSGSTVKLSGNQEGISYNNGETITKLFVGKNVQFNNCTFIGENGEKSSAAGYDACIYFFSGKIEINNSTVTGNGWKGQFLGLYGSTGSVTFNNSKISTVGNTGGWSYAMYSKAVLILNGSEMSATGMQPGVGNSNAFYSGDARTDYDAIWIKDSKVNFSDNKAGGFAINRVNIHVENSTIEVNDNLGNACNSGYWIVNNSTITMNGNRGGHALSCIGFEMEDSTLEVLHNGYAGVYIQAKDSSFTNCVVDVRCNGEKLLSYTAGDVWLNGHTLTLNSCEHVWLGGIGRKGQVVDNGSAYVVAYDLVENRTKSSTSPVLTDVTLAEQDEHVLLLNPRLSFDYARGDTEGKTGNSNDDDLFADVDEETATGKETAKIGKLTTAQLSHHIYDWTEGIEEQYLKEADETHFGIYEYPCILCAGYDQHANEHSYSFSCDGTYVYAPLVGLAFDLNTTAYVTNAPDNQVSILYEHAAEKPEQVPERTGYAFTGWYVDEACTELYDFETKLTSNWTVVYAGWEKRIQITPEEPSDDLEINKTASSRLDENYQASVTLSMPSYSEPLETDIVFVLDKSTSVSVEEAAIKMLEQLQAQVDQTGATVKVGVVIFNKQANTNGRLMDIVEELDMIKEEIQQKIESGTNTHAGLLAGIKLLDSGAADASRKYLIFVSDGITYIFDDGSGSATSIQTTAYENNANNVVTKSSDTMDTLFMKYPYGKDFITEAGGLGQYLTQIGRLIAQDGTKYWGVYGGQYSQFLKSNLNGVTEILDNDKFAEYVGTDYVLDHANNIDTALYLTYQAYQEAASKYHCYAMKATTEEYEKTYPWSVTFMAGLTGEEAVSFEGIQNDLCYLYGAGSEVTDVIGFGTNEDGVAYAFDFVTDPSTLILECGTVDENGELVDPDGYTLDETVENEDGTTTYYFGEGGAKGGEGYAFELTYYPNGIAGPESNAVEHFVLKFNRDIMLGEQVKLTYKVELEEAYRETDPGLYEDLHTNRSAYIDPVDSEGNDGERQFFPDPTTSYENIRVYKDWVGGTASASAEISLLHADGTVAGKATLNAANEWQADFLNIRENDRISESNPPANYTPSYSRNGTDRAYGWTVTNTYSKPADPTIDLTLVTIKKIWDDDGYSGRPSEIKVKLGVEGDPDYVGYTVTLSKNNSNVRIDGNTWTWSKMIGDRNYFAEEFSVPGYATKIEEIEPNYFVITNTYMPATGDDTPVMRYLLMICGAVLLIGAAGVLFARKRKA